MEFKYKIGEKINEYVIIGQKIEKDSKNRKRKNYYIKCLLCGDEKNIEKII